MMSFLLIICDGVTEIWMKQYRNDLTTQLRVEILEKQTVGRRSTMETSRAFQEAREQYRRDREIQNEKIQQIKELNNSPRQKDLSSSPR